MPVPLSTTAQNNQQSYSRPAVPSNKNVKRKSSKPIINWLQRKLGGSVRSRRPTNTTTNARVAVAADTARPGRAASLKELQQTTTVRNRVPAPINNVNENGQIVRAHPSRPLSNQISLNSTAEISDDSEEDEDDDDGLSNRRSSGAAASMWGSRSNPLEADEDASLRPLPPTSPPSPSPSQSSSSYLSDPRTFKSMSASTKPTTLLSIDLTPGVAHIAQAPPTPTTSISAYGTPGTSPITRFPAHVRNTSSGYGSGSTGLITFSALPPSSPPSSRPSSLGPPVLRTGPGALQAPAHTHHHPRNNPRPSSPPLDNASVLTLASSAFATPVGERHRTTSSYAWALNTDNASHLSHFDGTGDSISQIVLDGDCGDGEVNASVRALRPRSARRDSWESEVSRWSAGGSLLGALGPGGRERSVRTAPSFRTGKQTLDVDDCGSISLIDEDMSSMREDGADDREEDESRMETKDESDRPLSPEPAMDTDAVSDERDTRASESTEVDMMSTKAQEDDAATPGPAGRTLVLTSSLESMSMSPWPVTPSITTKDGVEVETTPKKDEERLTPVTDSAETAHY